MVARCAHDSPLAVDRTIAAQSGESHLTLLAPSFCSPLAGGRPLCSHPRTPLSLTTNPTPITTNQQVLLWYASLYEIFLIAFGQGKGTWRYGLDWQKWKPAGALVLVPLVAFIFFCLWCVCVFCCWLVQQVLLAASQTNA